MLRSSGLSCPAYASLRNFVSPDLALRKCLSQEALGPPGDNTFCLSRLGEGSLSPLATVRVHFPLLYEAFKAESVLALRSSGKLITKFLKSDEILSIF